jgi:hypothetical protein
MLRLLAIRFQCGKQVASYLGLVPLEDSSGNRRRLGHITKQGNSLLRWRTADVGAGHATDRLPTRHGEHGLRQPVGWEEVTGMGEAEQAGRYFYSTVKLNELGIIPPIAFFVTGIL